MAPQPGAIQMVLAPQQGASDMRKKRVSSFTPKSMFRHDLITLTRDHYLMLKVDMVSRSLTKDLAWEFEKVMVVQHVNGEVGTSRSSTWPLWRSCTSAGTRRSPPRSTRSSWRGTLL